MHGYSEIEFHSFVKTNFLTLDIALDIPAIPKLDFRTHFLLVAVVLPLAFSFVMVLFFKSFSVTLWYLLLLLSFSFMVGGNWRAKTNLIVQAL